MESSSEVITALFGEAPSKAGPPGSLSLSPNNKARFDRLQTVDKNVAKTYKKSLTASIWLCDKFPLNLEHLLPILDLLSSANPKVNRIRDFFEKKSLVQKNSFPLKAVIPIFLSVNAIINFENFQFKYALSTPSS